MVARQNAQVEAPFFETMDGTAANQFDFGLMDDVYSHESEPFVGKAYQGPKGVEEWLDFVVGLVWGFYTPMKGYYRSGCSTYLTTTLTTWVGFAGTFDKKFDVSAGPLILWLINPIYLLYMGYNTLNKCIFYNNYWEALTPVLEEMYPEDEGEDEEDDVEEEDVEESSELDAEDDVFRALLRAEEEESGDKDENADPYYVKPKAMDYVYVSIKGANVALAGYKIYNYLKKSYDAWNLGKNLAYFCTNTYLLVIIFMDFQKFVAKKRLPKVLYKKVKYAKKDKKDEKDAEDDSTEEDTEEETVEDEEAY